MKTEQKSPGNTKSVETENKMNDAAESAADAENKKKVKEKRDSTISFRVSRSQREKITVLAEECGMNLSDYVLSRAYEYEPRIRLTPEQEAHYRTAFSCVSAVWKRANNKRTATTDTLVFEDYGISRVSMEDLVLNERQRELMFEGKRWFDLVRLCRREGSNSRMVEKVLSKFEENTAALRIRLSATDALYWPYNESEMRANPYLVQNPAYENENITTTE